MQVVQQLEGVPDVLTRGLAGARPADAVAAIEGAAAVGTAPQVHHAAAFDGDVLERRAARFSAPVNPAATVGKQASGQRHDLICHSWRAGATRTAVV